jgi:transcriptional regulator with XRE-family HTH domain
MWAPVYTRTTPEPEVSYSCTLLAPRMAPKLHPSPDTETLGARIARLRHERGWTQIDLAKRVGVAIQGHGPTASSRSIVAWEHNESRPSPRMRQELAKAFEVSVDYLVTGIDTGAPPPSIKTRDRLDHVETQISRHAESIARLEAPDRRQGSRMRGEAKIANEISELREEIAALKRQRESMVRAQAALRRRVATLERSGSTGQRQTAPPATGSE